jgi:carbamoylphosphate synthase large subunit
MAKYRSKLKKIIVHQFCVGMYYLSSNIKNILLNIPTKYHAAIMTCDSKELFAKFMIYNHLFEHIPNTYFSDPINFPCVLKPICGASGKGIVVIKNKADYENSLIKFNSLYIAQDFVFSNKQYIAHVLCDRGQIIFSVIYVEDIDEEFYIARRPIRNYKKREMCEIEKSIFSKIMVLLNYHGMCAIDYTYNKSNELKIFEINPRMGASLFHDDDFILFVDQIVQHKISYD